MKREHSCVEVEAARGQVMDLLRKARENFLEKRDETKYVELELEEAKARGGKAQHEPRSGGRTQMPHSGGGASAKDDGRGEAHPSFPPCLREPEDSQEPGESNARAMTPPDVSKRGEDRNARAEESHDGGNYLSGRSESDDYEDAEDVSVVLSDDSGPRATEDESHYITTHEIQLSELSDHEGDFDLGVASSSASWDIEDDHRAYAFVDYAFASDGARESGDARPPPRAQGAAAVSTMLESDPTKSASSDESASKPQQEQQARGGTSAGQIHQSIKTTSRAINEPSSVQDQENILYHATRPGDMSRYVLRGGDGKAETLCDRAKCFIAAPGRVHFGGKLRGKEVTEYSSGTSSAVSELDDADKEVRNLTARAFKSLAYPYFDAINFSTSSESSASERGLGINRWSTFVDLKYGNVNMSQGLDQSLVSCQKSFEIAKNIDKRGYKGFIKAPGSNIFTLNGNPKQIQLMGQFGQGPGGVIRLTETLNFRCNVKSGMSAGERRAQFAQNAAGSRSADEVTGSLLSGQRGSPCKTMEDTQKKAVFASSLIKNVISKKMQFEQERKMERGEIVEPRRAPSPGCAQQESEARAGKAGRELQRQSSRFSESSSDFALMCVDELGDIVDGGSCPAAGTNLEPARGGGMDAKKGALEASKSTLLRSQNSAFRCWKDGDLGFQKDHKSDKTLEDKPLSARDRQAEAARDTAGCGKLTKMSHLFVPSIQLLPSDGDDPRREDGGGVMRSDNTLYITDSGALATSRSPEIKINLRSVRERKTEPFGASRPRAPNLGSGAAGLIRADEFKGQALAAALKAESAEKVPHFTVRDIRDNKAKLQTPIHQVRDVRKLVKSSYHFVSLDNSESRSADSHAEQKRQSRTPHSVSPIVIKCQSVNTNNSATEAGNAEPPPPEGAEVARAPGVKSISPSEGSVGLKKQEKASGVSEKKAGNRAALEKLQAAVKTMEQLYVFEKNEWKRKNEPRRLDGSHVMSLITRQEQDGPPEDGAGGPGARRYSCPGGGKTSPGLESLMREDLLRASSSRGDRGAAKSTPSRTSGAAGVRQQGGAAPPKTFPPKSPKQPAPLSASRANESGDCSPDSENYLTIPVKPKPPPPRRDPSPPPSQTKRSSIVMETRSPDIPPASIYHSVPQLYCFSPALTPGPGPDAFQPTQRKVLLDPATGSYYLVDAPRQPPTRRLFDPETGQYVDVPMTPVPVSPLALGPAPYGHAYMIYPGFMPAPALVPARTLAQSRASDADGGEKASQQAEGVYMEPPFYMATGMSPQQVGQPPHGFAAVKQPVISISSQQGPRIIAPPSFDGTTMSFVVEHR